MPAFLSGLSVGLSLIVAIGAQNAFVLKQGLTREHIFWVCLVCALSDALLIALGVAGFAKVVQRYPLVVTLASYFGAVFLFIYGLKSFYAAFTNNIGLTPSNINQHGLKPVLATCLAFTWLNPHVYLDTVVLMGSISVQFADKAAVFALGAMAASWLFFFSLGYGARLLLPLFRKPMAWRVLDAIIGVVMWVIGWSLLG